MVCQGACLYGIYELELACAWRGTGGALAEQLLGMARIPGIVAIVTVTVREWRRTKENGLHTSYRGYVEYMKGIWR